MGAMPEATGRGPGTGPGSNASAEFAGFYRARAAPLVAFLCVRGAGPADAASAAQDAMAAARCWTGRVPDLRTWTYRAAAGGSRGRAVPESPLLNSWRNASGACGSVPARVAAALAPLAGLDPR
ncbi:hypothetical protein [Streptomyces sp. NPDC051183]|uniref:hypothetical protein n=1 Tax=Streptomyces sp. NPDC051183 TaxID=3155165 RepID=UPI00343749F6